MTAPRSVLTRVNGVRLHHLDWEGAGLPVVCLHGLTRNAHDFDALARALAPRRRLLALDVRGRGESDWAPVESYALPQYAADLAAWLDALALPRAVLVGTSMGGLITLVFGSMHPRRVAAAVLNDVGPVVDPAGLARIQSLVGSAPETFADHADVVRWFRATQPPQRLDDAALLEWARYATKRAPGGGLTWRYDRALREQMRGARPAATQLPDLWPLAEALPGPTLVVRGGASDILTAETSAEMTRRMKDCRAVTIPGVGHAPSLAEPESLAAIESLLSRVT
jgi:pimeloyl-ACP methyl ester carboxylesterase